MKKTSITGCTLTVLITVVLYPAHAQWTKIDISSEPMNGVLSLCAHNGILYAGTWSGIQHSADSGKTWTLLYTDSTPAIITSLHADSGGIIAGVHEQGIVCYLYDNTAGWRRIVSDLAVPSIYAIASNEHTIFAATQNNGIYRSFDDGISWSREDTFSQGITSTSVIASNDTIFAAIGFSNHNLYRSVDNGVRWSEVYPTPSQSMVWSLAKNGSTLFAGCDNGDILRSIANGINWTTVHNNLSSTARITSFAIRDATVFAGTSSKGVLCSTDNGDTWTTVIDSGLPPDITIYSLEIMGATLFAGTINNGFWQLPIPDLVTAAPRKQERSEYSLSMLSMLLPVCHPDGTISFSLSYPDRVTITVTDIAGRESASIVNKRLSPGKHRYRWAADGLSPGFYVVQIRTGNDLVTIKSAVVQ